MSKIKISLYGLSAFLLAACAPSVQSSQSPKAQPSPFISGQMWVVTWPDGTSNTLKVPSNGSTDRRVTKFSETINSDSIVTRVTFQYAIPNDNPVVSRISIDNYTMAQSDKMCYHSGYFEAVLDQVVIGAYFSKFTDPKLIPYLSNGKLDGLVSCSMMLTK